MSNSTRPRHAALPKLVDQLFDAINVPLVAIDPQTKVVVHANTPFEILAATTTVQLKNQPLDSLFDAKTQGKVSAMCEVLLTNDGGTLREDECILVRASGRRVPVTVLGSGVKIRNVPYVLLSIQDLTRVRELEEQRAADWKEMTKVSKLADIGLLAAGVAHELNNPLMIVLGFAENIELMLERDLFEVPALRSAAGEIVRATTRMSRIITQMTRMVRTTDVRLELIDLCDIAQNAVQFLGHEIKFAEIKVTTEFDGDNIVRCDDNQVNQVILNLLTNAIHALEGKPDNREIRITCKRHGEWSELKIWNNGPEIPEQIRDKIMTPFFTTKEVGRGTGLGLVVSFGIMKAHGGSLHFSSHKDKGTEFRLRFPATQISIGESPRVHSTSIIVVEDDPEALELMLNRISRHGLRPIPARSGLEAFQLATDLSLIGGIVMNFMMPDMSALMLAQRLKRVLNPGPPLYVLSDKAVPPHVAKELHDHGVKDIFITPLEHTAFVGLMNSLNPRAAKQAA
jgi:PAS domain S-box-containing protein